MSILNNWLESFKIESIEDLLNAKREIMQEIVLAGLSKGGFFKETTFYGGTALRIHYGLNRYSEDLDFSLNYYKPDFSLEKYFEFIKTEFSNLGIDVNINLKEKRVVSSVESAFLKENTYWGLVTINSNFEGITNLPNVKIKIEVDRTPPLIFDKELKHLSRPFPFSVSTMTIESLFAGKMHAVLYRAWRNREKGRDWYDFEWYINKGISLNLTQLLDRAINSNHLQQRDVLNPDSFKSILINRINRLNIALVKDDVLPFIPDPSDLNIWSKQYFLDLAEKIKFV